MKDLFNRVSENAIPILLVGLFATAAFVALTPLAPTIIGPVAAFSAAHSPAVAGTGLVLVGSNILRHFAPFIYNPPAPRRA